MGLLDSVLNSLGNSSGGGNNQLLDGVLHIINQSGGVNGLADMFRDKGLGGLVGSWISTGQNLPISAEQIQSALGNEQLRELAGKLGISPGDVSSRLAEYLPQVVDKLTPDGNVPQGDLLNQAIGMLKGKL
jgi:uncharacterized protein YidB (DUF937 family)